MGGSPKCQTPRGKSGCTTYFSLQNLAYKNPASTCDITANAGEIECTINGLRSGSPVDYVLTLSVGGQHSHEIEFAEVMQTSTFQASKIKKENDTINPSGPKVIRFKVKYTGTTPDTGITIECKFRHGANVRLDECTGCEHTASIILNVA
jgi:hypothetical protein